MPSDRKPYYLFFTAFICLLTGVVNYFLFRPGVWLFSWMHISPVAVFGGHGTLQHFFNGHFSDIVWCTAICMIVAALSRPDRLTVPGRVLILLIPFISETGQYFSLIPGTFDWLDILAYSITILVFNIIFSFALIPFKMKKIPSNAIAVGISVVFLVMSFACATTAPRKTYYKPAPDPCVKHDPLSYSPVLVQVNIDGSYTMKDLSGAQRSGQTYFMDELKIINPYKYELAQGVKPNLNLYITVNTDSYQHYGAHVVLYVFDDNTYFDMASNYVDPAKLFDDIAAKINSFVTGGWHHGNCGY